MNTKELFTTNDFENLEWNNHPVFPGTIATQIFFENGYGASILTQTNGRPATDLFSSIMSSYGSRSTGTHEVAIITGDKEKFHFHFYEDMNTLDLEDGDDYCSKGGIWTNCNLEDTIKKIRLISCL